MNKIIYVLMTLATCSRISLRLIVVMQSQALFRAVGRNG